MAYLRKKLQDKQDLIIWFLSDKSRNLKGEHGFDMIAIQVVSTYQFKTSYFNLPSALNVHDTICELSVYLP